MENRIFTKNFLALLVCLSVATPAFAASADKPAPLDEELAATNVADIAPVNEKKSNPDIKFPHGVQIGVGLSATSGINGFVGYANKNFESFWWKRLGGRLDFATTAPVKSVINSTIDSVLDGGVEIGDGLSIDSGSLSAKHFAALVDFYPFGNTWFFGGLRLTGGYMFGSMNMAANLTGTITDAPGNPFEFEINGQQYRYTGNTVHGQAKIDWSYSGPYLGTGFDLGIFRGFKLFMDMGVVFTSKTPGADMHVPTNNLQQWNGATWQPVDVPELDDNIDEALADANDALSDIKFYPMVKLGFMYRF